MAIFILSGVSGIRQSARRMIEPRGIFAGTVIVPLFLK
jgi:hypothetical protein